MQPRALPERTRAAGQPLAAGRGAQLQGHQRAAPGLRPTRLPGGRCTRARCHGRRSGGQEGTGQHASRNERWWARARSGRERRSANCDAHWRRVRARRQERHGRRLQGAAAQRTRSARRTGKEGKQGHIRPTGAKQKPHTQHTHTQGETKRRRAIKTANGSHAGAEARPGGAPTLLAAGGVGKKLVAAAQDAALRGTTPRGSRLLVRLTQHNHRVVVFFHDLLRRCTCCTPSARGPVCTIGRVCHISAAAPGPAPSAVRRVCAPSALQDQCVTCAPPLQAADATALCASKLPSPQDAQEAHPTRWRGWHVRVQDL